MPGEGTASPGVAVRLEPCDPGVSDRGAAVFLQTGFWGEFKSAAGWKPAHFRLEAGGLPGSTLLVLERRLAPGFSFAYVPHGPSADPGEGKRGAFLEALARELRPRLGKDCAFVRFDPPWELREPIPGGAEEKSGAQGERSEAVREAPASVSRPPVGAPLRKAADVQPPDSVILRVDRPDEELLAGMKAKWRYNIRLAEKKGVSVTRESVAAPDGTLLPGALDVFYDLYAATSERDRIGIHPKSYYERLFGLALALRAAGGPDAAPDVGLWVARHEGEALAAIITVFRRKRGVYLFGASGDAKRNLMPAYALQWTAMRAAREAGCVEYDFYGIPPTDDPSHPMAGLYRIKTGFGGEIARYPGCWDAPTRPLAYAAYRAAESARLWWYKSLMKRLKRR
ncbi:MAG: peptidoglycan bridge formation glycyltransferase FemA/FemB family protein [Spirochaetales bacterium]|nr:peptidoglycan bridge formation glycyltransferase FemA/FemB family protein [Spirochaetales bacterium]